MREMQTDCVLCRHQCPRSYGNFGKGTIANGLELLLWEEGKQTAILDGDMIRQGLSGDSGFSVT